MAFIIGLLITLSLLSGNTIGQETPGVRLGRYAASKRALTNFRTMTTCATGRNAWDFVSYGCWCGVSGGGKPLDGIDRCCKAHDECYDYIINEKVCGRFSFFAVYYITYKTNTECTTCAPSSEYESWPKCRLSLCLCDVAAVKCFLRETFHPEYMNFDNRKCKETSFIHSLVGSYFRRNIPHRP